MIEVDAGFGDVFVDFIACHGEDAHDDVDADGRFDNAQSHAQDVIGLFGGLDAFDERVAEKDADERNGDEDEGGACRREYDAHASPGHGDVGLIGKDVFGDLGHWRRKQDDADDG